jgi:hypothetical protein
LLVLDHHRHDGHRADDDREQSVGHRGREAPPSVQEAVHVQHRPHRTDTGRRRHQTAV